MLLDSTKKSIAAALADLTIGTALSVKLVSRLMPRMTSSSDMSNIASFSTQFLPSSERFRMFGQAHAQPFSLLVIRQRLEQPPLSFLHRVLGSSEPPGSLEVNKGICS